MALTELDLDWCRAFIAATRWQEARHTGGGRWPHSYTVRSWHNPPDDWDAFWNIVEAHGVIEYFYGVPGPHLFIDGLKYWRTDDVLNRCDEKIGPHGPQRPYKRGSR